MLVITVPPHEYAQIGDDIKIYNAGTSPMHVGIEAPPNVRIVRSNAKMKAPKE